MKIVSTIAAVCVAVAAVTAYAVTSESATPQVKRGALNLKTSDLQLIVSDDVDHPQVQAYGESCDLVVDKTTLLTGKVIEFGGAIDEQDQFDVLWASSVGECRQAELFDQDPAKFAGFIQQWRFSLCSEIGEKNCPALRAKQAYLTAYRDVFAVRAIAASDPERAAAILESLKALRAGTGKGIEKLAVKALRLEPVPQKKPLRDALASEVHDDIVKLLEPQI